MFIALVLSQGIPRFDNFTTHVTLESRMVEVQPFNVSCDVSLALRDLSTDGTIPRLVLVLPHHSADASLECRHQF